jgi:hypothetical protein
VQARGKMSLLGGGPVVVLRGGVDGGGNLGLAAECFINAMKVAETVSASDVMQVLS